MTSPVEDLLTGLRDQIVTPAAAGPVTLFALSDSPDVQSALIFNRALTDPEGRWGQGVLTLLTRGERSEPLPVHGYADPVVAKLIALTGTVFGSATVNLCEHRGSSTGVDASKRTTRVDTFSLDLDYQA